MNLDFVPIWGIFVGTILIVMGFVEVGYRFGSLVNRNSAGEGEAQISGISGAVLGLSAFIMAFSFAIVADRYDARKSLVREDADAIRTTYMRARFLPEPDRAESTRRLAAYVEKRIVAAQGGNIGKQGVRKLLIDSERIQRRLWDIAVVNAERDMNSDVAALYIESLNQLMDVHSARLAIGVRTRIPIGIWIVLYSLTILGLISMGYHAGVTESKRSNAILILAVSFAMVITLIAALDRPWGISAVTQQPLADLQGWMAQDKAAPASD